MPEIKVLDSDATKSLLRTLENSTIKPYSEDDKQEAERTINKILKKRSENSGRKVSTES